MLGSVQWLFPGLAERTDWQAEEPVCGLSREKTTSTWSLWTLSHPDSVFLPQALAAPQPTPLTSHKSLPASPLCRQNLLLCSRLRTTSLPGFLPGSPSSRPARHAVRAPKASRFTSTASCPPRRASQLTPITWARRYRDSRAKERRLQLSIPPASFPLWRTAGRPAAHTTSSCRRAERRIWTDERDSWVNPPGRETAASGRTDRDSGSSLELDESSTATEITLGPSENLLMPRCFEWLILTGVRLTWHNAAECVFVAEHFTCQYFYISPGKHSPNIPILIIIYIFGERKIPLKHLSVLVYWNSLHLCFWPKQHTWLNQPGLVLTNNYCTYKLALYQAVWPVWTMLLIISYLMYR